MNIRWNQIALGIVIGFLLGAVFSHFYIVRRFPGPPPFGGGGPGGPMEMFSRELGLSEAQKAQISGIIEKYKPEMDKAMESSRAEMDKVRIRMKAELKNVLAPDQLRRLEELEKEIGKRGPHDPGKEGPRIGRGPF